MDIFFNVLSICFGMALNGTTFVNKFSHTLQTLLGIQKEKVGPYQLAFENN